MYIHEQLLKISRAERTRTKKASSKGALKIELSLEVRAEIFSSPPGNQKANDNVMSSL